MLFARIIVLAPVTVLTCDILLANVMVLSCVRCHITFASVTQSERPKDAKDKVKRPERPPARSLLL